MYLTVFVSIVGSPNVGKSTLLNKLAGSDKAIVSDVPGTTRDPVEITIDVSGIPVHFVDTAGIRDTLDQIEATGIERTKEEAEKIASVQQAIDYINSHSKS